MVIDKCFSILRSTNDINKYINIHNFIFEIFIEAYKIDNKISSSDRVSVFKAFKMLGAKKIDNDFDNELALYKSVRDSFIHQVTKTKEVVELSIFKLEDFQKYIDKYKHLIGHHNFDEHINILEFPLQETINEIEEDIAMYNDTLNWHNN